MGDCPCLESVGFSMLQLKVQGLICYNGKTLGFFAKFALHYTLNINYLNIHIISRKSKLSTGYTSTILRIKKSTYFV